MVRNSIRGNFKLQSDKNKRVIVPVLTPNTYGAYEPFHLEQMIYETMLNGGAGFFYFPWRGFVSPIYFYYHAKAMKNIIRYQDLIFEGQIFTPKCDNPVMAVSGAKTDKEALTLIGNYQYAAENCRLESPFAATVIYDVLAGRELTTAESAQLTVPKGRVRLLYWQRFCNE